jgi:hypothetical protein
MRILCDGLGRDSSSRGSRGRIRHAEDGRRKPQKEQTLNVRTALREKKRAPSTSIPCRVGSIGKRCNETMLTRDAARDISEADMDRIRGADGKNCVTSSVATQANLKPFRLRPLVAQPSPGHSRCGTHPRALSRKTWPINVSKISLQ